jgi:hypothetical protein
MPSQINDDFSNHTDYSDNSEYKDIQPNILTEYKSEMYSIKNLIYVVQTPPNNYAYIPWYISAGPQTHFGIYKKNDDKLKLIFEDLLIVYDGCTAYLIDKKIKEILRQNGLNNREVESLMINKYDYVTQVMQKKLIHS